MFWDLALDRGDIIPSSSDLYIKIDRTSIRRLDVELACWTVEILIFLDNIKNSWVLNDTYTITGTPKIQQQDS